MRSPGLAGDGLAAAAAGEFLFLTPSGLRAATDTERAVLCPAGADLHHRPAPAADGSLLQDPDFSLPTTAGPLDWRLVHDSTSAGVFGEWGYGRRASFPLRLVSGAAVVTVMHEDGTQRLYQPSGGSYVAQGIPNGDALVKNGDGSWDETLGPTGYQMHFPAGNLVSATYRQTPEGQRLTYNYDGAQRLQSVEEPAGRRVTLGYAGAGLTTVSYVQDWGDRRNTLTYDAQGNLTQEEGPTGCLTQYEYDAEHRLSEITDPEGFATSYTYDAAGRVLTRSVAGNLGSYIYQTDASHVVTTSYADALGRVWTHVADAQGQPVLSENPLGQRETYSYQSGRMVTSENALGFVTSYSYDAKGRLVEEQSPLGYRTTFVRDTFGNVTAQIDPLNRRTTISYGSTPEDRLPVTVMNALGQITTFGYTSWGGQEFSEDPLGFRNTWQWNSVGLLEAQIDALGRRTTFEYDSVGNQLVRIDMLGYRWSMYYDALSRPIASENPLGARWSTLYDARGLAQATIDPLGNRTSFQWNAYGSRTEVQNPLGFRSTWEYDASGALTAAVDALSNRVTTLYDLAARPEASINALGSRATTVYDAAGRPIASIDALGFRNTTQYDADGGPEATINARGYRTTIVYDAAGQAIAQQDALRYLWTTVYDALGRSEASINPLGRRVTSVYDTRGLVAATINEAGRRTSFAYDAAGQRIGVQTPRGYWSTTQYDVLGRAEASQSALNYRTTFAYDAVGQQIEQRDALGNRWTTLYDLTGRAEATVDPLAFRNSTVYDAASQAVAQVDALNRRTTTAYDAVGRVERVQNALRYSTTFVYDAAGQQIAIQDPANGRNTTVFDARGLVATEIDPLNKRQTYAYDQVGNRTLRTDGRGYVTTMVYDALDRETQRRYVDGTRVTWVYNSLGQLDNVLDPTGTTDNSYNTVGLLSSQQLPGNLRLTYDYDVNDNRTLLRGPQGARVTYLYDAQDRVTEIQNQWGERTSITWDGLNREQRRVFANGMSTSHVYDANGRETGLRTVDAAGVDLQRYTATYDRLGNRVTARELSGTRVTYAYDAAYQLTTDQRNPDSAYDNRYSYDSRGNRTLKNEVLTGIRVSSTYNAASELTLTQEPGNVRTTFAYDSNGNTLSEDRLGQVTEYSWDYENRMTGQVDPDGSRYTYTYRHDSRRVENETPDGANRILLWDELNCLQELDQSLALQAQYTDYPGVWGGLVSQRRGVDSSYYGFDLQWTGRVLVAQAGSISDSYVNDAWGVELASSGTTVNPYQYVGQWGYRRETSECTGAGLRALRRDFGRWVSVDSVRPTTGLSGFLYADNKPLFNFDPNGTQAAPPAAPPQCSAGVGFIIGAFLGDPCTNKGFVSVGGRWACNNFTGWCDCSGTLTLKGSITVVINHSGFPGGGPSPCTFGPKAINCAGVAFALTSPCKKGETCGNPKPRTNNNVAFNNTSFPAPPGTGTTIGKVKIDLVSVAITAKGSFQLTYKTCLKKSACGDDDGFTV